MSHVDDDDDDDVVDLDETPPPQTPWLTVVLCVLNLAAVLAAGYLLLKDMQARNYWAYQVFCYDLAIQGLPLENEEKGDGDAQILDARLTLEPEWLKEAYKKRTGEDLDEDRFRAADLNPQPIRPSDLREPDGTPKKILENAFHPTDIQKPDEAAQKALQDVSRFAFKNRGKPVATLEQEIQALEKNLPKMIEDAVAGAAAGATTDADRRNRLRAYLLPLVYLRNDDKADAKAKTKGKAKDEAAEDPKAVTDATKVKWREVVDPILQLDWQIQCTPGKDLNALIVDAARRKLLVDILQRLELFRPYKSDETWTLLREAAAVQPVAETAVGDKKPVKGAVYLAPKRYKRQTEEFAAQLLERVQETIADKDWKGTPRHGLEKRRAVAFLLYTLSRMHKDRPFALTEGILDEMQALGLPVPPAAREQLEGLLKKSYNSAAALNKALAATQFFQKLKEELPGDGEAAWFMAVFNARLADHARGPLYSPARAEVVSGIREFTRAAEMMPLVLDRLARTQLEAIQLDRGGGRYTLDYHVHDPKQFTNRLLRLLKRMDVKIPAKLAEEVEARFAELLKSEDTKLRGDDKEPGTVKVLHVVKELLKDKVKFANPKAEAEFDLAVLRLTDTSAPGFLVRHKELLAVIRDLAARVREKERRLKELAAQEADVDQTYYSVWSSYKTARDPYRQKVAAEVLALRDKSRILAEELTRLTREIFRAQVELANADRYNQALERYIRALEQLPRNKNKKRPGK